MRTVFAAGGTILILTLAFSANFTSATPGIDEPPLACAQVYWANLPSSSTYKDSDWFPNFLGNEAETQLIDLNGDGLVDAIYRNQGSSISKISCVWLNNGSGWDLVHQCAMKKDNGVWTFYGDCADV